MSVVTNAVRRMRRAAAVVAIPSGSGRWEAAWVGLLALAQLADVATTAVDLARGNVEANPRAAALISLGGLWLLWVSKLMLVGAVAGILVLSRRALAQAGDRPAGRLLWLPHFVALRGTQLSVVVLTVIALNNAAL